MPVLKRRRRISTKLLLTLSVVAMTVGMSGLATYAAFTSSTSQSQSIGSGTLQITLGATGASTNRLNIAATAVAPGDTIQRSVDLISSGTVDFSAVTLTTTATTSSLLDTDATNGLQMVVDRCSQAWTEAGVAPAYTYTCGGTTTSVLASSPVIGSSLALSNLSALTAGSTDHLRVTLSLPAGTGNSFESLTSVIQYTFTGTQRAGTNK